MSGGNTPEEHALPCWYYEKSDLKKTPSFYDGIPYETETRYRREGPKFIFQMGTKLGLHYATIATAVVYFHRFYMFHSFKKVQRHVATTCCLFIAGKVEETPKKCRDLIKTARSLLSDAQFSHFGDDPREEVMTMEKMLLHSIRFDFFVEHPYNYILEYAKALKGDRQKIEKLVQMAWTFVNDSLSTSLCLLWEPQIIAVAVMYLAGRLCKFEPQDWAYNRGRWWEQFIDDITPDLLEEICHQVLDQYSNSGKEAKKGENKAKRERPKTPKDSSSSEPQAKVSRTDSIKSTPKAKHPATHDHHHHATPGSSKKSASRIHTIVTNQTPSKPIQRRLSSSTNNDLSLVLNEEDSSNDVQTAKQIETIKPPLPTIPEPLISSKTAVPLQLLSHPGTPENGKVSYLPQPHNQYQSYHNSASTDMFYISHNNAAVAAASPASNVYKNVAVSQPSTSNYPMQSFPTTFPNVSPMAHNPLQSLSHRPPPPSGFPPPPPNPYTDFRRLPPPRLNTPISNPATTAQQMIYSASGAPQYNQQQQQHQQQHHQNPMPNHAVGLPRIRITGRRDQQNAHQWM